MTTDDAVVDVPLDEQYCFLPLCCVAINSLEDYFLHFFDITLDCFVLLWKIRDDATVLEAELPT
jgi:hypothetical protein